VKLVVSWMREFAAVPADVPVDAVAARLAGCGFEVADVTAGAEPAIDFEITANRPDCLSIAGLAREAAVAFGVPFAAKAPEPQAAAPRATLEVSVEAPDLCPRYAAQLARVRVGSSPAWLADRLVAAGVRPINNVVDVTNYVMLERGHPMHAFDFETLADGRIVVRRARAGERLRTLDDEDRALEPAMLAIADGRRAIAVAGVMGGAETEVGDSTSLVAFESAWFLPKSVRATSRRLGLKTDASSRFERGADLEAPVVALARAMELLRAIGAGEPAGPVIDVRAAAEPTPPIRLRASRIARLLGGAVPAPDVQRILTGLGFGVAAESADAWVVTSPSWRVDVRREADLIEEIGRHWGYDRLPTTFPALLEVAPPPDPAIQRDQLARRVLMSAGFNEAVTFTFIERRAAEPFASSGSPDDTGLAAILNPLSEKFAVLRPSLVPGLLDAVAHNRRHGRPDVRLFEAGACFTPGGEQRRIAFACLGRAAGEHWGEAPRGVDFFDARGAAEQLCAAFRLQPMFEPAAVPWLVPGRTARIVTGDDARAIGVIGQLAPAVASERDLPGSDELYVGELDLDALGRGLDAPVRLTALPRFPSIVRDISILVSDRLPAAEVRGTIRSAAPATLVEVREFDRYQGTGIPEGRASLSYHLTFRASDRTLTDAEVDTAMAAIVQALETRHGATRR